VQAEEDMIREKKEYMVFSFHTTAEAMAMEQHCMEHAIGGRLIPVPREISAGCGIAWRMTCEEYEAFADRLPKLEYEQISRIWM